MDQQDKDEATEFAAQIEAEADGFAARIMRLPKDAGTRRETTWQRDRRHKRFNAHGCGG